MVYLGVDQVLPEKQIGVIKLVSSIGFQYLYNVQEADISNPSLHYGDAIPLVVKGPIFGASNEAYLEFDLFCGEYKGKMDITWRDRVADEVSLRRVMFTSNDGTGSILVNIGTFSNARIANVEVKLLNKDKSAVANVSGVVFASNSKLEIPDCTSMLSPDNGRLKVGFDGVISLSKSYVGVLLDSKLVLEVSLKVDGHDCTGKVSFDAREKGSYEDSIAKDKESMVYIKVTWFDDVRDLIFRLCDENIYGQRMITLLSVDGSPFKVEEKVAVELHLLKDQIRNSGKEATIRLSGITRDILSEVIEYCKSRVYPSASKINRDVNYFRRFDSVTLFNLIQAANHFQIKSLMDLTCQTLAINVKGLKTKNVGQANKEFNVDDANTKSVKRLKRTYKDGGSILRKRGIELLINRSHLADVPISSVVTKRLKLFKKSTPIFDDCLNYFMDAVNCVLVDRMHLSDATTWLRDLLDGDAGFADNLSDDAVEILLQIFDNDKSVVWKYIDDDIQSLAIHILSRALSREKFHMYLKCAVPSLVKLFSNSSIELQIAGVIALTRLADTCPKYIPVMLEQNALGEVQKIASIKPRDSELVEWVTKFLAVICYRGLPQEKVKEALTISERLLQINSLGDRNIVSTCYALQYLTYGKHVPIEGKAWEKLIARLRAYISSCFTFNDTAAACFEPIRSEYIVVSGSALGVVGNFARWGNLYQIQALATDITLLRYFGKMLCCKYKKFSKEACQIISNLAARRQPLIKDMQRANLVEPLCSLLEKDMYESDMMQYPRYVRLETKYLLCTTPCVIGVCHSLEQLFWSS
ncbi:hypothetical protein POM88_034906 [Heracleum sosnowskyi]|uniref:Uncharacterized protein n=1 Tax=Heracleum sosnowskyi TaxID=360622 RepID=A0AAD8HKF6_9APIA|nr:hypothetical protein POM88_034906 [Heracleum sosnowskyi]